MKIKSIINSAAKKKKKNETNKIEVKFALVLNGLHF